MRTHTQPAIAALITAMALALAITATTATARTFSVSEREFEVLFSGLNFRTPTNTISCPLTLLGNYVERTIAKIIGTQVGAIRHVEPINSAEPPCVGGNITILRATLPWLIFYQGFTGALPRISAIRLSLIKVSFRVRTSNGIGCLAGATGTEPAFGEILINEATGRAEFLRADETRTIRLGGGFLCSLSGASSFSGTGTLLNLPGTAAITVTLI